MSAIASSQWRLRSAFALLAIGVTCVAPAADVTLIHARSVLTAPGEAPKEHQTLVIRDGRIAAILDGWRKPAQVKGAAGARIVDLSRNWVLPGLVDLHVHLTTEPSAGEALSAVTLDPAALALIGSRNAEKTLRAGFTTVLDLGTGGAAHEQAIFALRKAIASGIATGPRILAVGSPIAPTGSDRVPHFIDQVETALPVPNVCDGADACAKAVREQISRGADAIVLYNSGSLRDANLAEQVFTQAEMSAIVTAAHAANRRVIADGHLAPGINSAILAGADVLDTAPWPDDETWRLLEKHPVYFEGHMHAFRVAGQFSNGSRPVDRRVRDVLEHPFSAQLAHARGVPLAYGSDTGIVDHGDNGGDLEELVRLGLTPRQALEVATINSARAVGQEREFGTLEVGKSADLIAVEQNPLLDIGAMRSIRYVMSRGRGIKVKPAAGESTATIVWAGKLLTEPGKPLLAGQSIVIRDEKIERIVAGRLTAESLGEPGKVTVVDASRLTVMPGFFDLHVHLTTTPAPSGELGEEKQTLADKTLIAATHARETLDAGFTTVLDMGTGTRDHELAIYALRDVVREGRASGPRILSVGSPICAPGQCRTQSSAPQGICKGEDDCRRAVREQIRRGADVISIFNTGSLLATAAPAQTFTDEEMRTIVDTAHSLHRRVVADGAGTRASAAGVDAAIAAGSDWVDTVIYPDGGTWPAVAARKIFYAPHLYAVVAAVGDTPKSLETGSMGWLPRPILEALWNLKQQPPAAIEARRRNIPMAFASDAGVFAHGQNAGEFVEYVRAGLTPEEAIATATTNAAAALGLERESGSIRVGYRADLIGIAGDPLRNARDLHNVALVIAGGRIEKRPGDERLR